jgi:FlgD Ig-like domain
MRLLLYSLMNVLAILVILCCVTFHALAQQTSPPLKSLSLGNFWVYGYYSSTAPRADIQGEAVERVIATRTINGKQYGEIFNTYSRTVRLERSDSNNVYVWNGVQDTIAHSILWKKGDTINLNFFWHGCNNCRYVITGKAKRFDERVIKDTLYSYSLESLQNRQLGSNFTLTYIRKHGLHQIDTLGLTTGRNGPTIGVLGTTLQKGSFIDGKVIRDTNVITSVTEPPLDPVAQAKQQNANTQAAKPRMVVKVSAENPFTTRTTIRYTLEQGGNVELVVYNAQGVRLTTLSPAWKGIGEHTATWNGTNTEGQEVPSGTYFLVVFVNDRQAGEVKVVKLR